MASGYSPDRSRCSSLFIPHVATELSLGNIHIFLALVTVFGLRWPWLWSFVLLTKVTPGVGLVWFAVRREWRSLWIALGVTALIALPTVVLYPQLWADWIRVVTDAGPGAGGGLIVRVALGRRDRGRRCVEKLAVAGAHRLDARAPGAVEPARVLDARRRAVVRPQGPASTAAAGGRPGPSPRNDHRGEQPRMIDGVARLVSQPTRVSQTTRRVTALTIAVIVAVVIRALLLPAAGLPGDFDAFAQWVGHIANNGLPNAYDEELTFGPVMTYIWWLLGLIEPGFRTAVDSSDPGLRVLLKLPSTLADFGLAACVAWILRSTPGWAVVGAVIVLLHPATWYVSAWWGQYESIYVLMALLAVLFAIGGPRRFRGSRTGPRCPDKTTSRCRS